MRKITLPKNFVTIYDNKGETLDRYTIVFNNTRTRGIYSKFDYDCICASENGFGVFTWSSCCKGSHLGVKIDFSELSTDLQNLIIDRVVFSNDDTIQYHRKPTQAEIKFGEGAIHYKSFDKFYCTDVKGNIKKRVICPIDGLTYTI
jgi:hypothetical protein